MSQQDRGPAAGARQVAWSLLLGPVVWAVHLALLYGVHGVLCERRAALPFDARDVPYFIAVVTAVALAVLAVAIASPRLFTGSASNASPFYERAMVLLSLLSAMGVTWAAGAALVIDACIVPP